MNPNRNRGINYNNRGNGNTTNNAFASTSNSNNNNGTRRFSANHNSTTASFDNTKQRNNSGPTPSAAPTRNAWGVNSINAAVTGISSLSSKSSSSNNSNNTGLGTLSSALGIGATPADFDAEKHMLDRMVYLMAKSLGCFAKVTVSSGARYRGIIFDVSVDGEIGVVLAIPDYYSAAPGDEDDIDNRPKLPERLVFLSKDLVDIEIESPDLSPDGSTQLPNSSSASNTSAINNNNSPLPSSKFKTDTDISGKDGLIRERDLQRWHDDSDSSATFTLEESVSGVTQPWDQFAANERKFGVQSTYDEHYYTTTINRSAPDFEERERRAAQIANEIENSSYGGNIHIAEERGISVDDSGMDEEDKYSGVQRQPSENLRKTSTPGVTAALNPPRNPGKYTPPAFRAPTNQPNNKGIPYDPAIVTSQISGQGKPSQPIPSTSSPAAAGGPKNSHIHTPVSHSGGTSTPISALFSASESTPRSTTPVVASTSETVKVSVQPSSSSEATTPKKPSQTTARTPLPPSVALPASRSGKLPLDKDKAISSDNNVKNVTKALAGNFAQFVNTEVEKVQQKKQYLQYKEKSNRLHDFKKFSEGYKINTPVPLDMVPILGKRSQQPKAQSSSTSSATASSTPKAVSTPATTTSVPVSNNSASSSTTTTPAASTVSTTNNTPAAKPAPSTSTPKEPATLSEAISKAHVAKKIPEAPSPIPAAKSLEPTKSETVPASESKSKPKPESKPAPATAPPKQTPTPPSAPASSTASPAKPSPAPTLKLNLNFKAPEFRPNPAAHSFTPSYGSSPSHNHAINNNNSHNNHSAHSSPFISHPSPVSSHGHAHGNHTHTPRQRTGNLFFGSKPLNAKSFGGKFNLFVRVCDEYENREDKENGEPFIIEKAFVTPPTWPATLEKSYTELVPPQDVLNGSSIGGSVAGGGVIPLTGGVMPVGGMAGMGGMSGIGGVNGSPFYGRSPMVPLSIPPNMGGPGMIPVMQDPRAMMSSSPPIPSQVGFMGYPQYPGTVGGPQYPGAVGPAAAQFFGRPPQPFPIPNMMGHQPGYLGFQPQDYQHHPHHHQQHHPHSHQSPRVQQAVPVPQMNQQFNGNHQGFYSPQQQHQFLRSPGPHNLNYHNNNHGHNNNYNNRHRGGNGGGQGGGDN